MGKINHGDMSDINDRDIPTLGLPDPDFTVMSNSDGRKLGQSDEISPEDRKNAREY